MGFVDAPLPSISRVVVCTLQDMFSLYELTSPFYSSRSGKRKTTSNGKRKSAVLLFIVEEDVILLGPSRVSHSLVAEAHLVDARLYTRYVQH